MVSSLYKWLLLLLPVSLFSLKDNAEYKIDLKQLQEVGASHPLHVSVVEVNHNAADRTFEIICKIFTDDFENVLRQNYPRDAVNKTKIDLINPTEKAAMDTLVKKYISSHLLLFADARPLQLTYVGFERDNEAVFGYLQVDDIAAVKKINITNNLMYDLFTDQINLMHVTVGGKRKSTKLDYPATTASFSF